MKDLLSFTANDWFDVEELFVVYFVLGFLILGYAVASKVIKTLLLSEIVVSTGVGMLIGLIPNNIDVQNWFVYGTSTQKIMLEFARLAMCVQLVATALNLPPLYIFKGYKPLFGLLGIVLLCSYFTVGLLCWAVLHNLFSFSESMIIGGFACTTDPVIAASIVSGTLAMTKLSSDLRHLMSAQSAASDGLAYPLVILPLLFQSKLSTKAIFSYWFLKSILYDVCIGALLGFAIGWVLGRIFQFTERKRLIDTSSFFGLSIGLTLFVLGMMRILNIDEILAVFCSGVGFNFSFKDSQHEATKAHIQEAIDLIFTIGIFFLYGLVIPFSGFGLLTWRGPLFCILIILFKRIPFVFLIYPHFLKPYIANWKECLFFGWFGPIGVACLYYSAHTVLELQAEATTEEEKEDAMKFWYLGTQMILFSAVCYGLTDVPFTLLLYRYNAPRMGPKDRSFVHDLEDPQVSSMPSVVDTRNMDNVEKHEAIKEMESFNENTHDAEESLQIPS